MASKTELSSARRELKSPNKKTHRRALKMIKQMKQLKKGLSF
ncbi:putative metal homeostasis protein [Sporolactobacillus sp. STSJ-5]|nr:putative metal homeostasis protein [Sporolactobacillus sp. STSJ-5]MCQ2010230.1 putative metal homeostasis protein [Sporolactobacillus sp. STSJ-5]